MKVSQDGLDTSPQNDYCVQQTESPNQEQINDWMSLAFVKIRPHDGPSADGSKCLSIPHQRSRVRNNETICDEFTAQFVGHVEENAVEWVRLLNLSPKK
jgi:hypothetical protein